MTEPSVEELRMLLAVQARGSLTAAAEELGVTQQAVSQRMRALERRLGLALFARAARGTTLTAHGRLVADWAQGVVDQLDALSAAAASLRADRQAQLRVAASMTIAEHLMPVWMVSTGAHAIDARVQLTAVNSAGAIDAVRIGQVELGFIETPDVPRRLASRTIAVDEVVIVVAPGHPWAKRRRLPLATLARTPLVMREAGSGTRATVEAALARADLSLAPPAADVSTTAAIRALVLSGGGAAAISALAARDDLATGRLRRVHVDAPPFERPLTAIWDGERVLAEPARDFLAVAQRMGLGSGTGTAP
ncbi:LysR family transcriptional regulator [Demequina globuliformis]|uniref:LysR family transcriptional regulator n=1 Tax=Demequina globuliformis TaxID=676202 RepID=UPI0007813A21|nr:LysR family transcriptional regulator [Demequina globuliformis]